MKFKKLFGRKKQNRRAPRVNEFMLESLEPRLLLSATPMTAAVVTTDHLDYAPGETAVITASSQAGELVRFQVDRTDGMADIASTTAGGGPAGNEAWYVIDGIGGFTAHLGSDVSGDGVADWVAPDNDLTVNSSISTTWFVEEQYRNSSLLVTATGQASGAVASQAFTDANLNTTTVVTSSGASIYGDTVTLTATVTPAVGGTTRPVGSVEFFDGATSLGVTSSVGIGIGTSSTFAITASSFTAGSHAITAVFTGGANVSDSFNNSTSGILTQTVSQRALVGSFGADNKTYDGTTTATVLFADFGVGQLVGNDIVTLDGGLATFDTKDVDINKTVTLTGATLGGADASNYSLTSVSTTTADIDKAIALVTVTGFTGAFDNLPHGATGTVIGVDAGGAALGSSLDLGATFTAVPGGTANWTFLGGTNYTDQSGSVAIVINAAAVGTTTTVASSAATSTYGDAVTFTATVSAATGSVAPTGTVSFFDGATLLGTDSVVDSTGVGTATWSFTTAGLTAGPHAIHVVYSATGSFSGSQSADISQTVNQKSLTGNFTVATKVYDGTTTATVQTRTLTGVLAGDAANVSLTGGTATFDTATVGTGKTVTLTGATLAGTAAGNYSLTSVGTTTANITKATAAVTVIGFNGTFDNLPHGATGTVIGVDAGGAALGSSLDLGATFTAVPGGTANWTFLGGTNYTDQSGSVAIVINAVAVATTTVASGAAISTYGDVVTFTATVSAATGSVAPTGTVSFFDGATLLGTDSVVDSTGVGTAIWSFTTAGLTAGSHAIHAVFTGTAGSFNNSTSADTPQTVNQKSLTGNFTVATKVYDGTTTATVQTRTLTGVLAGDAANVSLTGGTATFDTATVGTGKTVTLTGATLAGTAAGNYSLTSVGTTTANITALALTGNFTVATKVYDGTTAATVQTRTLTGVLAGDAANVSLTGGTATFDTATVGTGKTVTLTGATLAGTAAGNYSLTSVGTTTANITALALTGNFTVATKVYDGTTAATVQTRTLTGVLAGDAANVSLTGGTATFDTATVGTGKTVTLTGATLAGTAAGNYSLTSVGTTTANITKATATVTVIGFNGTFDNLPHGATGTVIGVDAGGAALGSSLDLGATFTAVPGGTANWTFLGGTNYTDQSGSVAIVINAVAVATTTTVASSAATTTYGNAVTFTATVSAASGIPTGTMEFFDGATSLGIDSVVDSTGANSSTFSLTLSSLTAGSHAIHAVYSATGSFAGSQSADMTQTVSQKSLTGNFTVANKTYDATTAAGVATQTLVGVLAGDLGNVSLSGGTASFDTANVGNNKTVTLTGATLSGTASGNYNLTSVGTTTANITAKSLTGSFTVATKIYDATTAAIVQTRTLTGVIGVEVVSLSGGTAIFDNPNAGLNKTVTLTGATLSGVGAGNYTLASVNTTTANITAKSLTGSFTVANKIYDATTAAAVLTQTLTGVLAGDVGNVSLTGGTVAFADANAGLNKIVTLTGATLAGTAAGNYSLLSVGTATANIDVLGLTGDFFADSKVYDGTTDAFVAITNLTGIIGLDDVFLDFTGATFADKNAGIGKVVTMVGATLGGLDAGNYSLLSVNTTTADINKAVATVSVTGYAGVYSGASEQASGTALGVLGEGLSGLDLSGTIHTNAGTYIDAWVFTDVTGNYTDASGTVSSTIDKAVATVTVSGFTGAFDGLAHGATGTALGVDAGGAALGSSLNLGATFTAVPGGTANWAFLGGTNYTDQTGSVAVVINNTVVATTTSVSSSAATSTYGNVVTFTATVSAGSGTAAPTGTVSFFEGATLLGTDSIANSTGVGSSTWSITTSGLTAGAHAIHAVYSATGNFTGSQSADVAQTVSQRSLTGNFTVANKTYDATTAAGVVTQTLVGVLAGDVGNVSLIGGTAAFANANAGLNKTVTLTGATLTGAGASNYSLTSVNTTTANITAKSLTGNFTVANKVYDATTAATVQSRTLSGVLAGDVGNVSLTGGTATFTTATVGTGKTVTLTGATLAGTAASNYSLTSVGTTTANITALALTGNFTVTTKVYDGTTTATVQTRTLTGVLAGDAANVSLTGGTATFDTATVGTGKTVTLTGATLAGTAAGNYSLTSVGTTTANITALALTGNFTVATKVYDGTTTATVQTRTLTGVLAGDAVNVSLTGGTATFDTATVGTGKTVTLTGATLAGTAAGNYSLTSVNTTTANITAKSLTGNFTVANKIYDATTAATVQTRTLTGVIGVEVVNLIGGTATFSDANAGLNKTVTLTGATLTGAGASNYSLTSVNTTIANINKAVATVSVTGYAGVYSGASEQASGIALGVLGEGLGGLDLSGTIHTNAGTYIDAWVFTDVTGNYTDASGTVSSTIDKAVATVTVSGFTGAFDGLAHGATGTVVGVDAGNAALGSSLNLGASFTAVPGGLANWTFTGGTNYTNQNGSVTITINSVVIGTSTTVSSSATTSTYGNAVTLTATVSAATGSTAPTGTVSFFEGATLLGTDSIANSTGVGSSTWSITTSGLTAGTHAIHAVYSATGSFTGSQSGDLTQTVNKAVATIKVIGYAVRYDGAAHTATATAIGVNGEDLSAGLNLSGTTHTNVGSGVYRDTVTFTDITGNYTDATKFVANYISRAFATITVTGYAVRYDGAAHTATGTAIGVNGEDLSAGLNLSGTTHTNVGPGIYHDTVTFTDTTGNYRNATKFVKDYMSRAFATIKVIGYAVTYDGAAHTATGTAIGVNGEDLSADLNLSGTTHTNVGPGIYHDTVTFTDTTGNYRNATKFVKDYISRATATITVTGYAVRYDGAAHTATATAIGVNGEDLSADLNLSGATHTNAGTYIDTVTFTDVAGNYKNTIRFVKNFIR